MRFAVTNEKFKGVACHTRAHRHSCAYAHTQPHALFTLTPHTSGCVLGAATITYGIAHIAFAFCYKSSFISIWYPFAFKTACGLFASQCLALHAAYAVLATYVLVSLVKHVSRPLRALSAYLCLDKHSPHALTLSCERSSSKISATLYCWKWLVVSAALQGVLTAHAPISHLVALSSWSKTHTIGSLLCSVRPFYNKLVYSLTFVCLKHANLFRMIARWEERFELNIKSKTHLFLKCALLLTVE